MHWYSQGKYHLTANCKYIKFYVLYIFYNILSRYVKHNGKTRRNFAECHSEKPVCKNLKFLFCFVFLFFNLFYIIFSIFQITDFINLPMLLSIFQDE